MNCIDERRRLRARNRYTITPIGGSPTEVAAVDAYDAVSVYAKQRDCRAGRLLADVEHGDGSRWVAVFLGDACLRIRENAGRLWRDRVAAGDPL